MIYTTLKQLRAHNACNQEGPKERGGYSLLVSNLPEGHGDEEPIPFDLILDSNGVADALWALRAVNGFDKEIRLLVCDFAEHVLPIFESRHPQDSRPRQAIETARKFAGGECTAEELESARDAAWSAAWSAARDAAWSAAGDAAESAAGDAAWSAARSAAWSAAESAAWSAAGDAARSAAELRWQAQRFKQWLEEVFGK